MKSNIEGRLGPRAQDRLASRGPRTCEEQAELDLALDEAALGPEPEGYREGAAARARGWPCRGVICGLCRRRPFTTILMAFGGRVGVPICETCIMHSNAEGWIERVLRGRGWGPR